MAGPRRVPGSLQATGECGEFPAGFFFTLMERYHSFTQVSFFLRPSYLSEHQILSAGQPKSLFKPLPALHLHLRSGLFGTHRAPKWNLPFIYLSKRQNGSVSSPIQNPPMVSKFSTTFKAKSKLLSNVIADLSHCGSHLF